MTDLDEIVGKALMEKFDEITEFVVDEVLEEVISLVMDEWNKNPELNYEEFKDSVIERLRSKK